MTSFCSSAELLQEKRYLSPAWGDAPTIVTLTSLQIQSYCWKAQPYTPLLSDVDNKCDSLAPSTQSRHGQGSLRVTKNPIVSTAIVYSQTRIAAGCELLVKRAVRILVNRATITVLKDRNPFHFSAPSPESLWIPCPLLASFLQAVSSAQVTSESGSCTQKPAHLTDGFFFLHSLKPTQVYCSYLAKP